MISSGLMQEKQGGYKELWRIAYPLIITNASHTIMQFSDRKILSMNSTEDVAAALPGGILCFTLFTLFTVTTSFTGAIVSQYHGKKDRLACSRVPWTAFHFAILAGIICTFILPLIGNPLIDLGGHPHSILVREKAYFSALAPSGGFICMSIAFCSFFSGRGKTWMVAFVHFIACGVNILLDYLLILGKGGFPSLGIMGAGMATTFASALSFVLAFAFFMFQNQEKYPTRSGYKLSLPDIKRLLKFGIPSGVEVFFSVGAFSLIVFLVGKLGEASLAATTIALSINMLTFMPLLGMSEATGIIVGQYIGKGKHNIAEKATYRSWILSTLYMLLMAGVFIVFPEELCLLFKPSKVDGVDFSMVIEHGRIILSCAAAYNIFNAARFVFLGALRGAGDTHVPMWIIISGAWGIMAPCGFVIIQVLNMSVVAIWVFLTAYSFLIGGVLFWRFKSGAWKKIKLIDKSKEIIEPIPLEALEPEAESPHI